MSTNNNSAVIKLSEHKQEETLEQKSCLNCDHRNVCPVGYFNSEILPVKYFEEFVTKLLSNEELENRNNFRDEFFQLQAKYCQFYSLRVEIVKILEL